jgi:poly(hydroxyalkanoate) depolymerase family esterase
MINSRPHFRPATARARCGTLLLGLTSGALLSCAGPGGPDPAASSEPLSAERSALVTSGSFGGYNYRLFVPSSYAAGRAMPLVVMLHGCTQTPDQFAASTGMDALAESTGFLVVYPEQPTSANPIRCFRWFEPAHQSRGAGEPSIVAGIVGQIGGRYTIDSDRVYAAGFSAGAGLAVILGATYPDVFAAIAVGSGLEYKAASSAGGASGAMSGGGPNPQTQGDLAFRAMGSFSRVVPTLVFHGSGDTTVAPVNGEQIISQWAQTSDRADDGTDNNSIDDRADASETATAPGGRRYTHTTYLDARGGPVMEKYLVEGMGHAWSGSSSGSFTDPRGPNQSSIVWAFFRAHPRAGSAPPLDGGTTDAGVTDASVSDAATPDLGRPDMGSPDLAPPDLATPDLATPDLATTTTTIALTSLAADDGTVGALPVDGVNGSVLKTGDKGLFSSDTCRGIVSFDTSTIPAATVVRGAKLVLYRKSQAGNVLSLTVDVQRGIFGRSAALEAGDYGATATQSGVVTVRTPGADGERMEIALPPSALAAIALGSRTQLRLRVATRIDMNADTITWFDGAAGAQAPQLILTY